MGNGPSVIAPPPLPNGSEAPISPLENPAIVSTPGAENPQSAFGNDGQWTDLEQQLLGVFESRQAQSQGLSQDDDSSGEAGEADNSPADPTSPPVSATPDTTPVDQIAPPGPGSAIRLEAAPVPGAEPDLAAQQPPEPGPGSAYDPFALPQQSAPAEQTQAANAQSQTATPAGGVQLPPGYVEFMGTPMPIQEAQTMRDTYNWALSLSPEESNAINQLIQQRRTQGIQQPNFQSPSPISPTQYQSPQPSGVNGPPPQLDPATVDDPALATYLNQQSAYMAQQQQLLLDTQRQLQEISQGVNYSLQNTAAQQQQEASTQLERARKDFVDRYQLTPGELVQVEHRLEQSNIMPALVDRRNGDIYQAVIDGFETTAWTSPDLRQRLIAAQTQPAIDEARNTQQRAAKLGALGGSGGSVPRTDVPPLDKQSRHQAMVAEIAAAMNQNPS